MARGEIETRFIIQCGLCGKSEDMTHLTQTPAGRAREWGWVERDKVGWICEPCALTPDRIVCPHCESERVVKLLDTWTRQGDYDSLYLLCDHCMGLIVQYSKGIIGDNERLLALRSYAKKPKK